MNSMPREIRTNLRELGALECVRATGLKALTMSRSCDCYLKNCDRREIYNFDAKAVLHHKVVFSQFRSLYSHESFMPLHL